MEPRLIIAYTLIFVLAASVVIVVGLRWHRARREFHRIWGKQNRGYKPKWFW